MSSEDDGQARRTGPLLPEEEIKVACARTVAEWMDIYREILVERLKMLIKDQPSIEGITWENYRHHTVLRLRRIVRDFMAAGLDLRDDIEVSGIHLVPGHPPLWEDPNNPVVTFYWPDGQTLTFQGESALSAVGFFEFWSKNQTVIKGPKEGQSRIIKPGEAEHRSYFDAKAKDQAEGLEPT